MTELIAALQGNPILLWIVVVAAVVAYATKALADSSESVSKFLGPLGSRWKSKAERAAVVDRIRSERAGRDRDDTNAVIADLQGQVKHFSDRVKVLERKSEEKDEYLVYDAEWHATNEIHAAENHYDFPLPKHMTYNEFRTRPEGWTA